MVQIIIPNKICWGNAETDTAIAPVVVVSIFTDLLLGTQLVKQRNWFILQDNTSYNGIYICAPSLPMSSRTWE